MNLKGRVENWDQQKSQKHDINLRHESWLMSALKMLMNGCLNIRTSEQWAILLICLWNMFSLDETKAHLFKVNLALLMIDQLYYYLMTEWKEKKINQKWKLHWVWGRIPPLCIARLVRSQFSLCKWTKSNNNNLQQSMFNLSGVICNVIGVKWNWYKWLLYICSTLLFVIAIWG